MFTQMKTNFEQSLRARIFPVTPKQNGNNPGLNPEFHRGCTGKAHACGTAKSRLIQQANSNNSNATTTATTTTSTISSPNASVANSSVNSAGKKQVQRKNSISSETISDSGSENSAPSWLDATDCIAINNNGSSISGKVANSSSNSSIGGGGGKTPEAKKQLKKHNLAGNVSIIASGSGKLLPASCNVARKSPTPTNADRRRRLYSEGDRMSETGASNASTSSINVTAQQLQQNKCKPQKPRQQLQQQVQESTFERIQKYRSFRVGNNSLRKTVKTTTSIPTPARPTTPSAGNINNNHNHIAHIRPPWNSGSSLKVTGTTMATTCGSRNYRNSFRRRDVVDWHTIWERSFAMRGSAVVNSGLYKNYNEAIKRKVCKILLTLNTDILRRSIRYRRKL